VTRDDVDVASRCGRPKRPPERVLFRLGAAVRAFNRHVDGHPRVDRRLVPIGDGMTPARTRSDTTRDL
jgi:predicted O-methyltransferase YrrM